MLVESTPKQLEEALSRRRQGASLAGATGLTPAAGELEHLVALAERIERLPAELAPPGARERARSRFLAAGDRHRASWVHQHRLPHRAARHPAPHHPLRNLFLLGTALVIALVAGSGLALAAGLSEPDSQLYPAKTFGQRVVLALTTDPVTKAGTEVDLANQRFQDAEGMAAKGKGGLTVTSLSAYYSYLRDAGAKLSGRDVHDARWKQVRDRLIAIKSKTPTEVERGLTEHNDTVHLGEVRQLEKDFAADSKRMDVALGVGPPAKSPGNSVNSPPSPSPVP